MSLDSEHPRPTRLQLFLAELKRRRVFRVAAVYGATAFVVIQAADVLMPRLHLPDSAVTLVVALALLGFPLALALAWVFETGPEGLRRTNAAAAGELRAIVAEPRGRRWPSGIAALAGIALLAAGAWWAGGFGEARDAERYDSIAVLPFANLSGAAEQDFFADGLAEELLNALSGIPNLRVAARTSAFAFKGTQTDVRTIGDTLNVATVLEGSVRRSADRVRINVQLVDARSGYQMWTETYDQPLTDLFTVQNAIAAEIVDALAIRLAPEAKAGLYRGGTDDVAAYELYLLGRQKWATREVPKLREAVRHFEEAIARDSSFALAWSGLADAIDALAYRSADALHLVPAAKYAAQRALVLEPELAEGWASLGVLYSDFDRDHRLAELAFRRAIELKPSYAPAHQWLGDMLRRFAPLDQAVEALARGVELDPMSALGRFVYAQTLAAAGQWPAARAEFLRVRALGFRDVIVRGDLIANAPEFGFTEEETLQFAREWTEHHGSSEDVSVIVRAIYRPEARPEALVMLRRLERAGSTRSALAQLAMRLGDPDYALELLEQIAAAGDPRLASHILSPVYAPVATHPRFQRIAAAARRPIVQPVTQP